MEESKKVEEKKVVTKKANKLVAHWKKAEVESKGTNFNLELKKADLSSRADLIQADTDLISSETTVASAQERYDLALRQVGSYWSPARIVNARIELTKAQEESKNIEGLIKEMKAIIKLYVG